MNFRLITILYLFALLAASLAVFGAWGVVMMLMLLWFSLLYHRFFDLTTDWPWLVGLVVVGGIFWLATTSGVRHRSPTAMSRSHLHIITLGLVQYEAANGHFPPPYVTDDQGKPLYSWRVLILPYIEYEDVYDQFHLDETWDSPHNRALLDEVDVNIFSSPRHGRRPDTTYTDYVAVVGTGTVWNSSQVVSMADVKDGPNNTLLVIEAGGYGIHWSEPQDIDLEEGLLVLMGKAEARGEVLRPGYFASDLYSLNSRNVAFADGRIERLGPLAYEEDARSLLTIAGGEPGQEHYEYASDGLSPPYLRTIIHWDRVWGVAVWLALVLLPSMPAARRKIWPASKEPETEEQKATELAETDHRPG